MAPRKKKPPEFEDEPLSTPSEIDIEDFLVEWAPQTSVVEIYRRKEDGSMPHIKRVGMDILRADLYGYLRDKFGNGKFVLQFKDANRIIRKCLTVDVEGAPALALNGNGNGNGGGTFHEQLILALIASNRPAPPAPPLDLGALMAGIAAMMGALKPAPSSDPAAMLQAMAATFQQLKPPEDNVDKALSIISKAKELVPGGSDETSWPGLIKEGLTVVGSVLKPNGNGNNPPVQQRPTIPAGAIPAGTVFSLPASTMPPAEQQGPQAPMKTEDDILREWLQVQINYLKAKARAGKDVEYWIEHIFENQEEPGNNAILTAMERGATFSNLLTLDPEIGNDPVLKSWFEKLYAALHTELSKDVDTSGAGGDAPNPGGNGKSRP